MAYGFLMVYGLLMVSSSTLEQEVPKDIRDLQDILEAEYARPFSVNETFEWARILKGYYSVLAGTLA